MRSYGFGRMFSPGRLLLTASASSSSTTSSSAAKQAASDGKLMPVTVLSGFLGAGKTSFLQLVIGTSDESKRKYGLVVNDMATVNVDSKLIKQQTVGSFDGVDTLEF
jgi:Ni2+-binding GTPase involved in maturation of urease and hydrogenase